jgi:hypothetical protein
MKRAICIKDNSAFGIHKGLTIIYKRVIFRNGEHHYVTLSGDQFPAVFFKEVAA